MARINRATQVVFGTTGNVGTGGFGAAAGGNVATELATANTLATIMGTTQFPQGWLAATLGSSKFPAIEDMNALDYAITTQLAYLLQQGIAEYDSGTTYYSNNICCKAGTYQLYGSKTNGNVGNALTDTVNWQFLFDLSSVANNVFTGGTTTGSANAQAVATVSPVSSSFSNGQVVICTAGFTNTASATFSAGGETALTIKKDSGSGLVNLVAGDIVSGNTIIMTKNIASTAWVLTGGLPLGALAYLNIGSNLSNDGSGNLQLSTTAALATGVTAVTQTAANNSTRVATTAYVDSLSALKASQLLIVQGTTTGSTTAGALTASTWTTRTLNTSVSNNISGASLASNQITLPAGTYFIDFMANASGVNSHQAKLYNVTDSTDVLFSGTGRAQITAIDCNEVRGSGVFTISGSKVFEIRHNCETTGSTGQGFISTTSFGANNIWCQVNVFKVA